MSKDLLFLLSAPFDDPKLSGGPWFCPYCAHIEGALLVNPQWANNVEIRRIAFPRPRPDVIAVLGEEAQGCPSLIFADAATAPLEAKGANGRRYSNDALLITSYLAERFGGAAPHP